VGGRGEQFLKAGGIGIGIISIKEEGGVRRWWGRLQRRGVWRGRR